MRTRGISVAAVIVGVVLLMPLAGIAQMDPGKGMGSGGPMMMQGMMMQGMMKEMAEMMKGGAMTPEQQKRMGEMLDEMGDMMGGMHGRMHGMGTRSEMMGQMSTMMQHMAAMQKRMSEMMGSGSSKPAEPGKK